MSDPFAALLSALSTFDHQHATVFYPATLAWSDGTTCRCWVQPLDPVKLGKEPIKASLLKVRIHPDDQKPEVGSTTTYLGTVLSVGSAVDPSDIADTMSMVARVVDERVYPDHVTRQDAPSVRLRIVARGALPFTIGAGLQDVQGAPVSSHVGFVEPGVKLRGGEVLTLPRGDRFVVVPPLQHDVLGDTVGLSWQGDTSAPNPTPDPTPNPVGTPEPEPTDDSWWHQ